MFRNAPSPVALAKGFLSHVPGLRYFGSTRKTGGTLSARYCYSVWLRHYVLLKKNAPGCKIEHVAELGPGDSLGIGLAALLSGAQTYRAFDVIRYSNPGRNLDVFKELVGLFRAQAPIPDDHEFPQIKPKLENYAFPVDLGEYMHSTKSLEDSRLRSIENDLAATEDTASELRLMRYVVPWDEQTSMVKESVDLVYSQAVMEHVDDLVKTYSTLREWLRPGGAVSHQIDFRSHGTSLSWNGHWALSDPVWRLIRGKRPYLINRAPCSDHLRHLAQNNFRIITAHRSVSSSAITRAELAPRFSAISDEDLETSGLFVQALKM
jgi:hypothetical protein